jgi:hypothetical protein
MHASFKIHYRNNLIAKKDSYLISCPPSWDVTDLKSDKQALAVSLSLTGNAREVAMEVAAADLAKEDGMKTLIENLDIHYRNNLIAKKDSYLISCPPSWDDRNYSYGHQIYPSDPYHFSKILCPSFQFE